MTDTRTLAPASHELHSLVSALNLTEKARLLVGGSFWGSGALPDYGIAAATLTDGPHGVRRQRADSDHLGLGDSEPATAFPTASATGSSFDPELLREIGVALGLESRELGVDILLGPGINIKRSPLCGRNFEYFSEDPFVSGELGAAWVDGVQSQGVGASVKHFAANNQETDRQRLDVVVDERTLREIYLPAFEKVVTTARPATVMCSYNKVNGVHASQNAWLLDTVLRGDWGFDGYVVSDWGAVVDAVEAVRAGLDLDMPANATTAPQIVAAVESGDLDEASVDIAVSRILSVHERIRGQRTEFGAVDYDAHHALARRAAIESAVLLTNDDVLPLDPRNGGPIAVIGAFATSPRYQGAGSSHIHPTRIDDALSAIAKETAREVIHSPGFALDGTRSSSLVQDALSAASASEQAIIFLGLPDEEESEGFDRAHLRLPTVQLELLAAVCEVNPNVIVVLSNGGVVELTGIVDAAPAVLEMWLAGQASGSAVASILFGSAEPGGRLAETIPHALPDTPAYVNWPGHDSLTTYGERIYVGYRWYDRVERSVAFPFGHGLGYTRFEYSDLMIAQPHPGTAAVTVSFSVRNVGARRGAEVAQVYVNPGESAVDRPVRELRGFRKLRLDPGESTRVELELDSRAFSYWNDGWIAEPGDYVIDVGSSSRSIHLTESLTLDVSPVVQPLHGESTMAEWFAHPIGSLILAQAFGGAAAAGSMTEENMKLAGWMPLRAVMNMSGGGDGRAIVAQLLAAVNSAQGERSAEQASKDEEIGVL